MSFSASHIEIILRYTCLSQNCQTARQYTWDGAAIATATPAALGEAWWNHVKTAWRALATPNVSNAQFMSVLVREVGGGLAYGEYAIPPGEQQGTRPLTGLGETLPSFMSAGVRLTVSSGVTRPGQMRVPFVTEGDVAGQALSAGFITLVNTLADLYDAPNTLGAPTATGVITPNVVRYGANNDLIAASQPIVGHVTNPNVTTQVSRRIGHGS
jgi:hypothetical protein